MRWQDLENRLAKIHLKCAEKVVFVRGDASVDFQNVAHVIDLAHHAGVQRVGLLPFRPDESGRRSVLSFVRSRIENLMELELFGRLTVVGPTRTRIRLR